MEEWRDIPGYEGKYQVSNLGRVKSLSYHMSKKEKVLSPCFDNYGYYLIQLSKDNSQKTYKLHRLVWEAFNGPVPEGMQINHINENRIDNRLENLNLMTPKENVNWGTRTDRAAKAMVNNPKICKQVIKYSKNNEFICVYPSARQASRETGISYRHINDCCREYGYCRSAGGFIWRYAEQV